MSRGKFFYCYSSLLNRYLHDECGYDYITKGIHPKTKGEFWMYERSDKLNISIDFFYFLLDK
jgi:hypothetical protein